MTAIVHTLGDSTLDNLYWTLLKDRSTAEAQSVEGQLQAKGYQVESHAYDGFTTQSVLEGDRIGWVLPHDHHAYVWYMNKKNPSGNSSVHPLQELQESIQKAPDAHHYVVLSVGGNDFRANLANPLALLQEIPQIQERYLQIVEKLKGLEGRNIHPILMLQYKTDAQNDPYWVYTVTGLLGTIAVIAHLACFALMTAPLWALAGSISGVTAAILTAIGAVGLYFSHSAVSLSVTKNVLLGTRPSIAMLGGMMERFYRPILAEADKAGIPILDLPNTFNPYQPLYDHGIEPSAEGAALIAEGIDAIIQRHLFTGKSCFYAKKEGAKEYLATAYDNPADWAVR